MKVNGKMTACMVLEDIYSNKEKKGKKKEKISFVMSLMIANCLNIENKFIS